MAKGTAVTVLNSGERPEPMNQAPGSPIAKDTRTLKKACLKVKSVMRKRLEFSQRLTPPRNAFEKLAP